jgi:uncharacterized protein DUF5996
MAPISTPDSWPDIPYAAWKDTCTTLHMWVQIVGKIRLVQTPWLNHSWHVVLYISRRGLTTSPIPYGARMFQIDFDFVNHVLWIRTSDGHYRQLVLRPQPVAEFYLELFATLSEIGIDIHINDLPNEVPDAIRFRDDVIHTSYDPDYVNRFWLALVQAHRVLSHFRTGFIGKASPVHFFWGGPDLAVTRFSGRRAPRHPGGIPNLPDIIAQEAYSHEVSSAGFWPGGGGIDYAAFYSYAYPAPAGLSTTSVLPAEAFWSKELGEFILPYDMVRTAKNPDRVLMDFLMSTYVAAAELGKWDRAALECELGEPRRVRKI